MNPKLLTGVLILTLSLAGSPLTHADPDSHRQEIEKLFKLTNMEQKVNESVTNIMQLQIQQNPQLADHQRELADFLNRHIGWAGMKEDIATMYMAAFTEKELAEMNAFYITPTGQKVINDVPTLVQRRNQLAMQRLRDNIGELQQLVSGQPQR